MQRGDAIVEIIVGNKLRMFARDQQDVAEALRLDCVRLAFHFLQRQGDAQDRVVAREAAVFAIVDALVGKVKRREQADDLAEALLRRRVRPPAHVFQQFRARRRNQMCEIGERQFRFRHALAHGLDAGRLRTLHERFQRQRIEFSDKTHDTNIANRSGKVEKRAGSVLICRRRGNESFGQALLTSCPTAKFGHCQRAGITSGAAAWDCWL